MTGSRGVSGKLWMTRGHKCHSREAPAGALEMESKQRLGLRAWKELTAVRAIWFRRVTPSIPKGDVAHLDVTGGAPPHTCLQGPPPFYEQGGAKLGLSCCP